MKNYIGIKAVQAEPEERDGQAGYAVVYGDGYRSWSPAAAFDEAYHEVPGGYPTAMDRLSRAKQALVYILQPGSRQPFPDASNFGDEVPALKFDVIVVEPSGDAEDPMGKQLFVGIKVAQPGGTVITFDIDGDLDQDAREELALLASERIAAQVHCSILAAMGDEESKAIIERGEAPQFRPPFTGDDIATQSAA